MSATLGHFSSDRREVTETTAARLTGEVHQTDVRVEAGSRERSITSLRPSVAVLALINVSFAPQR